MERVIVFDLIGIIEFINIYIKEDKWQNCYTKKNLNGVKSPSNLEGVSQRIMKIESISNYIQGVTQKSSLFKSSFRLKIKITYH